MELKYVGAMPVISEKGVGFDKTKPDKYTFLNAAVELLEALSFGPTPTTQHLYNVSGKEYSGAELMELLKKYCTNMDEVFTKREASLISLKSDLIQRVNDNKFLDADGKQTWLNNIELMSDYYDQFVTNETAYQCALEALSQEIHDARIKEVTFPVFRNYGLVLHDLDYVMQARKPPIDSVLTVEAGKEGLLGKLALKHV